MELEKKISELEVEQEKKIWMNKNDSGGGEQSEQ